MTQDGQLEVAILLTTYNGSRFIEAQVRSLTENKTPFTLHWLDDHSTDNTREMVRRCARDMNINFQEWHQPQHLGWQVTFFELMEHVDADIYFFCDQDDIWQSGKIDAAVADLKTSVSEPTLVFSQALMFSGDQPRNTKGVYKSLGLNVNHRVQQEKIFTFGFAQGNTIAFTRPLREMYLLHRHIARVYASAHDWWMYMLATASGIPHRLINAPTTLYRVHANNACGMYSGVHVGWRGITRAPERWRFQHRYRRLIAWQAKGFCLASKTLPQSPKLERLLDIAQMVSVFHQRQPLNIIARLTRLGGMPPSAIWSTWLAIACLTCDATDRYGLPTERALKEV